MSEFKVGDRVTQIQVDDFYGDFEGDIAEINNDSIYIVNAIGGNYPEIHIEESRLTHVEHIITPAQSVNVAEFIKPVPKEADRFNTGKVELSLLPKSFLDETAKVLMFGAQKYDRNNWKKGMKYTSIYDSLQRHLTSFIDGEDLDPESKLLHLGHAACNLAFLIEYHTKGKGTDDRYKED